MCSIMNSGVKFSCELQSGTYDEDCGFMSAQQTKVELKWNYKYFNNTNCFCHQPGLVLMKTRSADTKLMGNTAGWVLI